jgi:hypothetical protein
VWVDGGVEHRAAAAWANYLEFARPERLAHHAECDCASCESFHLFSHAGFDGLNHCVDNRSITSMGSGQQNSTIEAEWKTFAWRHSLEQQVQNCEFDLKHPDSAGIPTEFVVPFQPKRVAGGSENWVAPFRNSLFFAQLHRCYYFKIFICFSFV